MSAKPPRTITVAVPPETYEPFRQQAERANQSVEQAVVEAMQAKLAAGPAAADQRSAMLAALERIDTPTLWQIIHRGAETEDILVLAALNERRTREGLTVAEEDAVKDLIRHHDRAVLIRARALAELRRRGEDVSAVLADA